MSGTVFEGFSGETQLNRIRRVIARELTTVQREIILAYYFQDLSIRQIAELRGISKSSVYQTLRRAEARVRRILQYYTDSQ